MLASSLHSTRAIDNSFESPEELLKLVPLHDTIKGTFKAVNNVVSEHDGFDKLSGVVTDGALAMQGKCVGSAVFPEQSRLDFAVVYYIIHLNCIIYECVCSSGKLLLSK